MRVHLNIRQREYLRKTRDERIAHQYGLSADELPPSADGGLMPYIRPAITAVLAVALLAAAVQAAPFRSAKVGDRMGALVVGLVRIPLGSAACGPVLVDRAGWVVPGRPLDEGHASFVGGLVRGKIAVLVSYDEENLDVAAVMYADVDGKGLVTHVWPTEDSPPACWIVVHMLHWGQGR
jgi:hypothetical protein